MKSYNMPVWLAGFSTFLFSAWVISIIPAYHPASNHVIGTLVLGYAVMIVGRNGK